MFFVNFYRSVLICTRCGYKKSFSSILIKQVSVCCQFDERVKNMNTNEEKLPISVVILARNEEKKIEECLKSCEFAKEIILVDDNSDDSTIFIAKKYGAIIFNRALDGNWGAQQTFGIQQASQPWLLLLDCDERVSHKLRESISKAIKDGKERTYCIQRENHFKHHSATHGPLRSDWVKRLMPNKGISVEGFVHPQIISKFPTEKLQGFLIHYPYDNAEQYYRKLNKYSELSANKYLKEGRSFSFLRDVVARPLWAFFKVYFINLGFLDGKIGFIFAVSHYSYTFQKYVRFYLLKNSDGEF